MLANSKKLNSILSLAARYLLDFKLPEFTKILAATFHNVRVFLSKKDKDLHSYKTAILKFYAILRYYLSLQPDTPPVHELVKVSAAEFGEVEEAIFWRTLENLENAVAVGKLTGDVYYQKLVTKSYYF
jgi:hypothetical protein